MNAIATQLCSSLQSAHYHIGGKFVIPTLDDQREEGKTEEEEKKQQTQQLNNYRFGIDEFGIRFNSFLFVFTPEGCPYCAHLYFAVCLCISLPGPGSRARTAVKMKYEIRYRFRAVRITAPQKNK